MSDARGYLLGTDVGTSGTKTVLVGASGALAAEATIEYPMHSPRAGWAENDPDDWYRAVVDSARRCVATGGIAGDAIRGWCLVAQRDPFVLLDGFDRPLGNSISWIDRRTLGIQHELLDRFGLERLVDITGVRPIAGLSLHNLLWIKRFEPSVYAEARRLLFVKDYLVFRLAGIAATDRSTPSRSVMNDVRRSAWSEDICEAFGINTSLLPEIRYEPWQPVDGLSPQTAALVGLEAGTPLAAGGGDDQSAAFGAGTIDSGDLCGGTGTASGWRCVTRECKPEPAGRADLSPHVVPDRYLYETTIASTGSSLRWARDLFAFDPGPLNGHRSAYDVMVDEASAVPIGSDGLFYYPYLEGARTPRFNDEASGVFYGLRSGHTRAHMVRAILEGVAFQYPPSLDLVRSWGVGINRFSLVDGESRSDAWNQMKADVIGQPIGVPRMTQSAAVGAAMLAGLAAGVYRDPADAVRSLVQFDRIYEANSERHALYEEIRKEYERVYAFLDKAFRSHKSVAVD